MALRQLAGPAEVEALAGAPDGLGFVDCWAWEDEAAGRIRARVFAPRYGIAEDEATGAAAVRLVDWLGRPVTIRQGAGSLLHEIDRTVTAMGGRLLRAWLLRPLVSLERIRDRLDAVEELAVRTTDRGKFRETIKEAGPNILKAVLHAISTEANRIFGEILGDRSSVLSWEQDYEIVLRRDGRERSFAQLSGGEQMSAALAVRLALLRGLSRLDMAFFDEPTQNMDGERRGNLAEQIRRVRGFEQLVVISHDVDLLAQVLRHLREKGFGVFEALADPADPASAGLLRRLEFTQVDTGVTMTKALE